MFGKCDGANMCMLHSARPSVICYDRLLLHSYILHFLLKTHDCSVVINDLQLDQSIIFSKKQFVSGKSVVLVLQDGGRRNSPETAIFPWSFRHWNAAVSGGHCAGFMTLPEWRLRDGSGEKRAWLCWREWFERRDFGNVVLKKLAENSNLKMITGERAIGGTWY
jgi:hypothetical protein